MTEASPLAKPEPTISATVARELYDALRDLIAASDKIDDMPITADIQIIEAMDAETAVKERARLIVARAEAELT